MKIVRSGVSLQKRGRPQRLEVDRIGQDQKGPRIDVLGCEQIPDLPFGLLLDPGVDSPPRLFGRITEVDLVKAAVVVHLDAFREVSENELTCLTQERIGREKLDVRRLVRTRLRSASAMQLDD